MLEENKNKYYVPDISEFCIGLDYRFNNAEEMWFDEYSNLREIVEDLENLRITVKYLDQDDIKSLGWVDTKKSDPYYNNPIYRITTDSDIYYLFIQSKDNTRLKIEKWGNGFTTIVTNLFLGYIKNKSELKKLMQQLRIDVQIME